VFLMHWPVALNPDGNHHFMPMRPDGTRDLADGWDIRDTWKQLEAVLAKGACALPPAHVAAGALTPFLPGKVKAIGVSNMSQAKLEWFLPSCAVVPAANQLELHAHNPDHALVAFCKSKGIVPQAYSPLGSSGSPLAADTDVQAVAAKHGAAPAEVLLGWLRACPSGFASRNRRRRRLKYVRADAHGSREGHMRRYALAEPGAHQAEHHRRRRAREEARHGRRCKAGWPRGRGQAEADGHAAMGCVCASQRFVWLGG
jgi:diketogulonate reductase-like aldo/keto reductase